MPATRVLWGQLLVVAFIVLLAVWGATEWTAWRLAFQPQLRPTWFKLLGWPIYPPPAFFWWWFAYDAYAPRIFVEGAAIATLGSLTAVAAAIGMSIWRAREAHNVETYGSARWADLADVRSAGLLGEDGVVLGRLNESYLRHQGPEHVLCFAPTRSGKGVGLVVPSLLAWSGSAIVHDIKGENWQLTAGFRAHHGRVMLSIRPIHRPRPTILCSRSAAALPKFETSRMSPTCWSIPKVHWRSVTIGRKPATRCWSVPSSTSSMPSPTRRSPASPRSCPIRGGRSRPRWSP